MVYVNNFMKTLSSGPFVFIFFFFAFSFLMGNSNETYPSNKHHDVILVLGNSPNPKGVPNPLLKSRLDKAIEIYKSGISELVIVSGASVTDKHIEAEVMAKYLQENNIPKEHIVVEPKAKNTIENIMYAAQIMNNKNLKSVLVVTSSAHAYRAEQICDRLLTKQFEIVSSKTGKKGRIMDLPLKLWERFLANHINRMPSFKKAKEQLSKQ